MLKEAERLYGLGFAIIWLHPKSKRPIDTGWTKGPRKSWEVLRRQYRQGMNMGVRLGFASQVGFGFLAVLDCDVKSSEERHRVEAEAALARLRGDTVTPWVRSGRGGGSSHTYMVTAEPLKPRVFERSKDMVRVRMPSAKPSRRDVETLGDALVKQGYRMRPAWEISVMGEGQQVVLPPSIHPDTGATYEWGFPFTDEGSAQELTVEKLKPLERTAEAEGAHYFKAATGATREALKAAGVTDRVLGMIWEGDGVEDRSAALLTAALSMVRAGLADEVILTVLTDPETFLGEACYDHAKTRDRARAAAWVRRYTLGKARAEVDAREVFKAEVVETVLGAEEAAKQSEELTAAGGWESRIQRQRVGDKPQDSMKNIRLILQNAVGSNIFRLNEFSNRVVYGLAPPWNDRKVGEEVGNVDVVNIQSWLADHWRLEPAENRTLAAVLQIGSENRFHPVKEYLEGLEWDGVPRIDTWLRDYAGADAREPYLSAISRKVLCAMVARVYEPGIKFDHVLVLEGGQGIGKSTIAAILGDPWFTDAKLDLRDKDSVQTMFGQWVIELGELASLRHADLETTKAFISRRTDRIRVSFGRVSEDYPRQSIFIGTTNEDEYLKDVTGDRRFWPVACDSKGMKIAALRKIRNQLMAEALFQWGDCGEVLYLEGEEAAAAKLEQEQRLEHDVWVELFEACFARKETNWDEFQLVDLFSDFGPLSGKMAGYAEQKRAAKVLRRLGYTRIFKRVNGAFQRVWVKK